MKASSFLRFPATMLALATLLMTASTASTQGEDVSDEPARGAGPGLRRSVVASGGGQFSAGARTFRGTIGQAIAGPRVGGGLGLTSGYWAPAPAAPPTCPGDANFDRLVNFSDITSVLANFNMTGGAPLVGDANGSGAVDFSDITSVLAAFNSSCP
ncbi:MAG: hypothetical protein SFZ24_06020 [Planctomycetota bacterium]|nr:hypothetical protein [Planctomycetota bacterium]